jgi:alpha-ketoglutarate-dependent taurine dioxygenase
VDNVTSAGPKAKTLGSIRRKAVDLAQFNPVKESLPIEGSTLPLMISPASDQVDLAEWTRSNRDYLEQKLYQHGGILFRGFDLKTPQAFEGAVSGVCRELFTEYGDLPREGVAGKIYTSTPYPEDKAILYHNESSHMSSWPAKINFFCLVAAKEGGCSPIVDCRKVYQQVDLKVRDKFENLGLLYMRNFSEGLDVSWQRFFHTDDKAVVEDSVKKAGFTCEWHGKDNLRVMQKARGVLAHPVTGEKTFFNQVQLHHVHCLDDATRQSLLSIFKINELPRHVYYGDGSDIEDSVMDHIGEVYERNSIRFQWQEGDMVSLDNMLTAHARDPFVGPRKILVGLGDLVQGDQLPA